jgi:hypothetical protein
LENTRTRPDAIVAVARKRSRFANGPASKTKKADVVQRPKAFDHVGLLVNKPPGKAELLFI